TWKRAENEFVNRIRSRTYRAGRDAVRDRGRFGQPDTAHADHDRAPFDRPGGSRRAARHRGAGRSTRVTGVYGSAYGPANADRSPRLLGQTEDLIGPLREGEAQLTRVSDREILAVELARIMIG